MNKRELARDPNTSPEVLEKLVDDDCDVRFIVVRNPNCPEYIKTFIEARDCMHIMGTLQTGS